MPDSTVFLGLDLGTSGTRVVAVDLEGNVVAEATRTYPLLTPRSGWTEQRPSDWLTAAVMALRDVAEMLDNREIGALSFSGQMHGMVALDAKGRVIRPAILWNDQRTGAAVQEIEAAIPRPELIRRTGNRAATGFQLPKILWMRANEPEAYARVRTVLLPKDYLAYILTGVFAAEPSDASGTGCFHLASKTWDTGILNALDIDPGFFPDVIPSTGVVGALSTEVARQTGLPENLPVVAGAGDNAAAATGLGLSNRHPRRGSVSLGTSGVLFMPMAEPEPDPEGRVHLFCHADGTYHLLGVTLAAAGSLQWYRDTFAPKTDFSDLAARAADSPPGAHGVTFRPYLAGERTPHMNPDLRASWTGLSLANDEADVIRSVLEGVAFSLHDALDVMRPLCTIDELLATGGGARSDLWLHIVADVLQVPLIRPRQNHGAAFGAALLAMLGSGAVDSLDAFFADDAGERLKPGDFDPYEAALARFRTTDG